MIALKTTAIIAAAVMVAGLAGWLIGASGRSAQLQQRHAAEQRADITEARALIAEGRVALYLTNFGDASKKFEGAIALLARVQTQMRESAQAERAGRLEIAIAHTREAQRLAASFDAGAHTAAQEALKAITP